MTSQDYYLAALIAQLLLTNILLAMMVSKLSALHDCISRLRGKLDVALERLDRVLAA